MRDYSPGRLRRGHMGQPFLPWKAWQRFPQENTAATRRLPLVETKLNIFTYEISDYRESINADRFLVFSADLFSPTKHTFKGPHI